VANTESLARLDAGERVVIELTAPGIEYSLTNEEGQSGQIEQRFHRLLSKDAVRKAAVIPIRCPKNLLIESEAWVQKVESAHRTSEQQNGINLLLPSVPSFLKLLFDNEALRLTEPDILSAIVPPLRFSVYCGGVVKVGTESIDQKYVQITRLVVHTTPTPLAAKSIRQKFAFPGRAFEKSNTFSVDVFNVNAIGSESFHNRYEQHLLQSSPSDSEYLSTLCFGDNPNILQLNRAKYQNIVAFVERENAKLPSREEIESSTKKLADNLREANKAFRILTNGAGDKLRSITQDLLLGSPNPLLQLQQANSAFNAIDNHVSDNLRHYFEKEVFGNQVFLGIDYRGVHLLDGESALSAIRNLVAGVGVDVDAGDDKDAIQETLAYFNQLTPQLPAPKLPARPLEPSDPFFPTMSIEGSVEQHAAKWLVKNQHLWHQYYEPTTYIEDSAVSAALEIISYGSPLPSYISRLAKEKAERLISVLIPEIRKQIASQKDAIAEHKRKISSGAYNNDPTWRDYLAEKKEYEVQLVRWRQEVEIILAPWHTDNANLAKLWPTRRGTIASRLYELRQRRTMMRVEIEEAKRAYENTSSTTNQEGAKSRICFVPDIGSYVSIPAENSN
jgi:hypothetical protein